MVGEREIGERDEDVIESVGYWKSKRERERERDKKRKERKGRKCVCLCVCVCERERERESASKLFFLSPLPVCIQSATTVEFH